eukprot:scaffold1164_cov232-Pinguiococcus_pyrenoidosus.AAC.3
MMTKTSCCRAVSYRGFRRRLLTTLAKWSTTKIGGAASIGREALTRCIFAQDLVSQHPRDSPLRSQASAQRATTSGRVERSESRRFRKSLERSLRCSSTQKFARR